MAIELVQTIKLAVAVSGCQVGLPTLVSYDRETATWVLPEHPDGAGVAARLVNAAAWISLAVLTLALALQKIASFDYWWHLRTGQLIAETGAVPKLDPFTFTVPGHDQRGAGARRPRGVGHG